MNFEPRTILLKDGRNCILRPTHPNDSEQMIDYLKTTANETPYLLRYPDEVTYTLENEREILGQVLESRDSVMMVAVVDDVIAGNCAINGLGNKRKIRHRCSLAIALKKEFWNLGIGTAMISYTTTLAKQIGYEQMELEVVDENTRAAQLYEKCGFRENGRHVRALKYDDGVYRDELIMSKLL